LGAAGARKAAVFVGEAGLRAIPGGGAGLRANAGAGVARAALQPLVGQFSVGANTTPKNAP